MFILQITDVSFTMELITSVMKGDFMKQDKTRLATVLFVLGIFLAGLSNATSKYIIQQYAVDPVKLTALPFLSTLLFCTNLSVYLFLLVFWIHSVQQRLLPSRSRSYLITAACCAIAMLILRSIKYRLIDVADLDLTRYVWYSYYVPMILLPTLFLMTCIRIERKGKGRRFDERLLLIPASVLILLFLTNDLHYLAFRPNGDTVMTGANASYFNNVIFYLYYVYYGVTIVAGLILLVRINRRLHSFKKVALPFAFLLMMLALALIDKTLNWVRLPSMFTAPEIVAFGMVGIFESCVRNRLIPYNENYAGFFTRMRFPAIITDEELNIAHRSSEPVTASSAQLSASLEKPLYTDEDTKLTGRPVTAGYAFYTEDESELHRMNERLVEANELIASENDLIQAENELKTRQAAVDSRNVIYARIARVMLPYHRRALKMLDEIHPGEADCDEKLARLNLLNAYIKRGTNLLLVGEGDGIPLHELEQAAEESALYLGYCGVQASVAADGAGQIARDTALRLYTAFQQVIEAVAGSVTQMHIAVSGTQIRLTADGKQPADVSVPAEIRESDGLYYFIITGREGEAL